MKYGPTYDSQTIRNRINPLTITPLVSLGSFSRNLDLPDRSSHPHFGSPDLRDRIP